MRKAEMTSIKIDEAIIPLLKTLNSHPCYSTIITSSCSGRISITTSSKKNKEILISHEPLDPNSLVNLLFSDSIQEEGEGEELVFRFEPFILDVECKDITSAQSLVSMAISCGFTESGITNVQKHVVVVSIRGSIRLEVPLGSIGNILVSPDYVRFLVNTANQKLELNRKTIDGFSQVLVESNILWNQDWTGNEGEGNFENYDSAELIVAKEARLDITSIPEELYHEILLRVPVKSLLVSKCVCKTWYQLISNPDFVKSHLNRNNNLGLMFLSGDDEKIYYVSSYDSLLLSSRNEEACDISAVEMDHPFKSVYSGVSLLGTCHGLLLLHIFEDSSDQEDDKGFLCLWNPATREYKKMRPSPNEAGDYYSLGVYAFGYDYRIGDYKVFKTVDVYKERSLVNVYTLGLDSWKSIQSIPYSFPCHTNKTAGVLVNGFLHWAGKTGDGGIIVSLNVSSETFKEMKLPKEALEEEQFWFKNVEVLEGCLCVFNLVGRVGYEVWVMQDYGVQESWTKRYVINHERIWNVPYIGLKWLIMNGEIFQMGYKGLVLYDPRDASARVPKIRILRVEEVQKFVESLVSLNSGTFVGEAIPRRNGANMKKSSTKNNRSMICSYGSATVK